MERRLEEVLLFMSLEEEEEGWRVCMGIQMAFKFRTGGQLLPIPRKRRGGALFRKGGREEVPRRDAVMFLCWARYNEGRLDRANASFLLRVWTWQPVGVTTDSSF